MASEESFRFDEIMQALRGTSPTTQREVRKALTEYLAQRHASASDQEFRRQVIEMMVAYNRVCTEDSSPSGIEGWVEMINDSAERVLEYLKGKTDRSGFELRVGEAAAMLLISNNIYVGIEDRQKVLLADAGYTDDLIVAMFKNAFIHQYIPAGEKRPKIAEAFAAMTSVADVIESLDVASDPLSVTGEAVQTVLESLGKHGAQLPELTKHRYGYQYGSNDEPELSNATTRWIETGGGRHVPPPSSPNAGRAPGPRGQGLG